MQSKGKKAEKWFQGIIFREKMKRQSACETINHHSLIHLFALGKCFATASILILGAAIR